MNTEYLRVLLGSFRLKERVVISRKAKILSDSNYRGIFCFL